MTSKKFERFQQAVLAGVIGLSASLVAQQIRAQEMPASEPSTKTAAAAVDAPAPRTDATRAVEKSVEAPIASPAKAPDASARDSDFAQKLYDRVTPSLVGVQFTWEYEFGKLEYVGAGLVVADNVIATSLSVVSPNLPDEQLKDFKVILPRQDGDDVELDAVLLGRDERTGLAFVRLKEAKALPVVKLESVPLKVGQPVLSVGILAKSAGYRSYLMSGTVASLLRGATPEVLVDGALGGIGSPVFDVQGRAVGFVNSQSGQQYLLHSSNPRQNVSPIAPVVQPPHFFTLASDLMLSLKDLPKEGEPLKLPWLGITQVTPLKKEMAEVYNLENKPAVEIGDIVPGSPADKAGLKTGQIIVQVNGSPLERGDAPEEVDEILVRKITRMKVGEVVKVGVIVERGKALTEMSVTLEERTLRASRAKRHYFDDLGFSVREAMFEDIYYRKLPLDSKGVVIGLLKPQGAAQNGKLQSTDLVTTFNGKPVTDLQQFIAEYEAARKDKPSEAVVLVVTKQDGTTQTIRIEAPR